LDALKAVVTHLRAPTLPPARLKPNPLLLTYATGKKLISY